MALRCSLFGHAFGDADVERARTEQGERVLVTVREVRTCGRCGATDVVAERTETAGPADARRTDVGRRGRRAGGEATAGPDAADPETDDGVIIEDDPGDGDRGDRDRGRGEWPRWERSAGGDDAPRPWPEHPESSDDAPDTDHDGWLGPDDDGFDAEPTDGEDADVEFGGGGLAPDRAGDPPDDAEIIEPTPNTGDGWARASGATGRETPPDRDTEFGCPECGFAVHSAVASVRAGDVCPDCRSGYLEEWPAGE